MSTVDRDALLALAHCVEPGDPRLGARVRREGPAALVSAIARRDPSIPEGVCARYADSPVPRIGADGVRERAAARGARIIVRGDAQWPGQLADLGDREPFALWVTGAADLRLALLSSVAMVGARACTAYGQEVAHAWAADLAQAGATVVSGGAFGIDAAAHRGALAAGLTVCVVAGGVDIAYPRAHEELLARIADGGLVLSEAPLGEQVRRQRFLTRNRLIAALTRATVVVEAAERSGTASTAREAQALGRVVAAVPGPVTSASSVGCHRMVREREAELALSAADVLLLAGLAPLSTAACAAVPPAQDSPVDRLDECSARVHDALPRRGGISEDDVVRRSGLARGDALAALALLEVQGLAVAGPGGWRCADR